VRVEVLLALVSLVVERERAKLAVSAVSIRFVICIVPVEKGDRSGRKGASVDCR